MEQWHLLIHVFLYFLQKNKSNEKQIPGLPIWVRESIRTTLPHVWYAWFVIDLKQQQQINSSTIHV